MATLKEMEAAHAAMAAQGSAEELRASQAMLARATTEIVRSLMRDRVRRMQLIARDYAAEAERAGKIREREIAAEAAALAKRLVYAPRQAASDQLLAAAIKSRDAQQSSNRQLMFDL